MELCIGTGWCAQKEGHNNPQKDCNGKERVIETVFHNYFCNMFTPWPFGYGRIRPIDFSQQAFYAQQLTDQEIKEFTRLEGLA